MFLESEYAQPKLCSVITHLSGWYGDMVIGDGETTLEDIYLERLPFQWHPLGPMQTAFIPALSQVSATLSSAKLSPCVTGTWHCVELGFLAALVFVFVFLFVITVSGLKMGGILRGAGRPKQCTAHNIEMIQMQQN